MFETYSGATKIIPLIGYPIEQTKSPFGMTQGFARRGADFIVVPIKVPPGGVGDFLKTLDGLENLGGVMATVPHKFALCGHADIVSERARFYGSANVMRRGLDGRWLADMLDGLGFVKAILAAGGTIANKHALLVGAGGAGGAIALELLNSGASSLAIHDTDPVRRDHLIAQLNAIHAGKATAGSVSPQGHDLIINATPLGMKVTDPAPISIEMLDPSMFIGDVVTAKGQTPLLNAAASAGCAFCSGHDMFDQSLDLMLDFFM